MYRRTLNLPKPGQGTFFLWGARQVGKSHLLKRSFPDAVRFDLLRSEEFMAFQQEPWQLRERLKKVFPRGGGFAIIDEIQKVPQLLDEVHLLIEDLGFSFALCGSSARALKRAGANLLGGRAQKYELFGLTYSELGLDFDLEKILNRGYLPAVYASDSWTELHRSYCADYLKEEVASEGLVRNIPVFSRFLNVAALSDAEILSYEAFARDCGVSVSAIKNYFEILADTHVGSFLPAYTHRPKRRVTKKPKFYFNDVGVVNFLARRGVLVPGGELFGKAFESWVHHEIRAQIEYSRSNLELYYWKLTSGAEVDFIIGQMGHAVEAKAKVKITADDLRGLRELKVEYPLVGRRVLVCLVQESRITEDGIEILSVDEFMGQLAHLVS
jgi:uncharacterized protein